MLADTERQEGDYPRRELGAPYTIFPVNIGLGDPFNRGLLLASLGITPLLPGLTMQMGRSIKVVGRSAACGSSRRLARARIKYW
ncbi:hypothetical protein [Paraburkholderia xenovorans]|uniref:hypothetical protein n=1 Tax=Paraburkholderia xenovorans TaxID=36873 RepID=UPI001F20E01F|nr:hypothetical protein [Paraburkholderia xenovorans]